MSEPMTKAGRALLDWLDDERGPLFEKEERAVVRHIRKTEAEAKAEARAALLATIRERVGKRRPIFNDIAASTGDIAIADVLAILDELEGER